VSWLRRSSPDVDLDDEDIRLEWLEANADLDEEEADRLAAEMEAYISGSDIEDDADYWDDY